MSEQVPPTPVINISSIGGNIVEAVVNLMNQGFELYLTKEVYEDIGKILELNGFEVEEVKDETIIADNAILISRQGNLAVIEIRSGGKKITRRIGYNKFKEKFFNLLGISVISTRKQIYKVKRKVKEGGRGD